MLGRVVRLAIRKERFMANEIPTLKDLIYLTVEKVGTKAPVAMGGIGAITYLSIQDKTNPWVIAGIALIVLGQFVSRHMQEINATKRRRNE